MSFLSRLLTPDIDSLAAKRNVPRLVHILETDDDKFRRANAARALGKLCDLNAASSLANAALHSRDDTVQVASVHALAQVLGPASVDVLLQIMSGESSPKVRQAAIETLGDVGDPRAIEPLVISITKLNGSIRAWHGKATSKVSSTLLSALSARDEATQSCREAIYERRVAARALGKLGPRARDRVITLMSDDWTWRIPAYIALGVVADKISVDVLLNAVAQKESVCRSVCMPGNEEIVTAVEALGNTRNPAAFESLVDMLYDAMPERQVAAIWALADLGDQRSVEKLRQLVTSSTQVKQEAAKAALNQLEKLRQN